MTATPIEEAAANKILIEELVARARAAQRIFETYDQEKVDEVVMAIGWAVFQEQNARYLADLEYDETGMGNAADKFTKNTHRTKGAVWSLMGKKSVGVLDVDVEPGITRIAKPMGVVGALTPMTNAASGTVGNATMICKCRNAVIFAPNPKSKKTSDEAIRFIRAELERIGAPPDIVQGISNPTKELSQELMRQVDCVVATGGAAMVEAAYSSGTPALGVGAGNAVVVIDETADPADAAKKVATGKTFDHATSCSSENSVIVHEGLYDAFIDELKKNGGYLVTPEEKERLREAMWQNGALNGKILCRPATAILDVAGIVNPDARSARFLIVPETGVGREHPFSGEKLSPVLAAYRFSKFDDAVELVQRITGYQGRGHSCGIHSKNQEHILQLAMAVPVCRVLVNQIQAFGNSGNFNNGLNFTATLGCGSWGGNSISENVTYEHLMNVTRLVMPRENTTVPGNDEVFGAFRKKWGLE